MTQSRVNIRDMLRQAKISETQLAEWERVLESQGYRRAGDGPLSDTWIKDDEPKAPLSPAGMVTLFVDGSGVEIPEGYLLGTAIKDGDDVSKDTLDQLSSRHRQRLAAAYGAGQIKQGQIAGEYPPPDVLEDLSKVGSQEIAHMTRTGTITGRFTRTEPPFHEQKPSRMYRPAQDPRTSHLVKMDLSKIEERILASMTEPPKDLGRFNCRGDYVVPEDTARDERVERWAGIDKRTLTPIEQAQRFADLYGGRPAKLKKE